MPPTHAMPRLLLASSSPYRKELLERLRIPFDAFAPEIDETPRPGEAPEQTAMRLAREKAAAVASQSPGALVIGSDQVATLDGEQIGKPGSHEKALKQLQKMRGRKVIFHTAICLWDTRSQNPATSTQVENVRTLVTFRDLPDHELDTYLHIEKPYDCAGSAKNEGLGITLLESIESPDPTALTGLPLITLCTMLRRAGFPFFTA